jgi:predicted dehydrogenase
MTLRVGLIGFGYWGPNLARVFSSTPGVELTWVAELSEQRRAAALQRYPTVSVTPDYRAVLQDPAIDAIVISTPVVTHHALAKEALQSGKHVLVEKPLATSAVEAAELAASADQRRLTLMVDHIFLYEPAVRYLRDIVRSAALGEIRYIHAERLNFGRVQTITNALWSLAPQDVSILLYLLDAKPQAVQASGIQCMGSGVADVVFMRLFFHGGLEAHVHVSWLDPEKVRRITLVGSKKMAVYDDTSQRKLSIFDRGAAFAQSQVILHDNGVEVPEIESAEPLRTMADEFVKACLTHNAPLTGGQNGVDVVAVLEAAQDSLLGDGGRRHLNPVSYRAEPRSGSLSPTPDPVD